MPRRTGQKPASGAAALQGSESPMAVAAHSVSMSSRRADSHADECAAAATAVTSDEDAAPAQRAVQRAVQRAGPARAAPEDDTIYDTEEEVEVVEATAIPENGVDDHQLRRVVDLREFGGSYASEYQFALIDGEEDDHIRIFFPQDAEAPSYCLMTHQAVAKLPLFPASDSYTEVMYDKGAWAVRDESKVIAPTIESVLALTVHDWMLARYAAPSPIHLALCRCSLHAHPLRRSLTLDLHHALCRSLLKCRCKNKPGVFLNIDQQFDALTRRADGEWVGRRGPVVERHLTTTCVETLFKPELIAQCLADIGTEHHVTQGGARIREPHAAATPSVRPLVDPSAIGQPRVEYPQHELETCVFYAAASALHEMGVTRAAAKLAGELANESLGEHDRMRFLLDVVTTKLKGVTAFAIPNTFDPITDDSPHPIVFAPRGSDGSATHAACKLGDWLFDASRAHALPFCTPADRSRSLDLVVRARDADVGVTYAGLAHNRGMLPGVRIVPSEKMLGKRRRADA